MKLIACVDQNWGIGLNGKLLLSIPDDMKYFKEKTYNKTVVMGRQTFESLSGQKPLENRRNIVLSKNSDYFKSGIEVSNSIDDLFKKIGYTTDNNVYVIGGESIYRQLLSYCSVAYITKIFASYNADRKMINVDMCESWKLIREEPMREYKGITYRFLEYIKV